MTTRFVQEPDFLTACALFCLATEVAATRPTDAGARPTAPGRAGSVPPLAAIFSCLPACTVPARPFPPLFFQSVHENHCQSLAIHCQKPGAGWATGPGRFGWSCP
jgi:hypothetical protein